MQRIVEEKLLTAKAVIGIYPAHAENETVFSEDVEFNFPRQQVDKGSDQPNYSLADFIAPKDDFLGMFAVTTGHGLEAIVKEFEDQRRAEGLLSEELEKIFKFFGDEKEAKKIANQIIIEREKKEMPINTKMKECINCVTPSK